MGATRRAAVDGPAGAGVDPDEVAAAAAALIDQFRRGHATTAALDPDAEQVLTALATFAVLEHRALLDLQRTNAQLQTALDSRVVIEQAKGMLAARTGHGLDHAFTTMRAHSRSLHSSSVRRR